MLSKPFLIACCVGSGTSWLKQLEDSEPTVLHSFASKTPCYSW